MIHRIKATGFKKIDEIGIELELAPVTLLLGRNAVGKSSVFQLLFSLAQSWETPSGFFELSTSGAIVDCGKFSNVLHRTATGCADQVTLTVWHGGDATSPAHEVEFCWGSRPSPDAPTDSLERVSDSRTGRLTAIRLRTTHAGTRWEFRFTPLVEETRHHNVRQLRMDGVLLRPQAQPGEIALSTIDELNLDDLAAEVIVSFDDELSSVDLSAVVSQHLGETAASGEVPPEELFAAFDRRASFVAELSEHMQNVRDAEAPRLIRAIRHAVDVALHGLRRTVRRASFLQGLRDRGRRFYPIVTHDRPWNVGISGERTIDVLATNPELVGEVNLLLQRVGVPYSVAVRHVEGIAATAAIELYRHDDDGNLLPPIGIADTGSGVAQLLPVLVQIAAMSSPERLVDGGCLLVEQPELHLHPAWQSRLARLLAAAAGAVHEDTSHWESGGYGIPMQLIAETHSEVLALAFGVLIRQGDLRPRDVSVLALGVGKNGQTTCRRIRYTRDGYFLDEWPDGFFPERDELLDWRIPGGPK